MVVLRLSRVGKKNHPTFRLIVSDKRRDTKGTYLELLGSYDPHQSPARMSFKADRVKYWLSVGAQSSDTVHNLLVEAGIITAAKKVVVRAKKAAPAPSDQLAATAAEPAPAATA